MDQNVEQAMQSVPPKTVKKNEDAKIRQRKWQGIPGVERTKNGRLFVTFYSGGTTEGDENFVLLVVSDDDGQTWSEPTHVIDPPGRVRAFDPCLWHDPDGRLWWFWCQSYTKWDGRGGVWACVCDQPDEAVITWQSPVRIANGVMMNKPTVLSSGEWLLACAVWAYKSSPYHDLAKERFSNVVSSVDKGRTFRVKGGADVPDRAFDEHMVVEREDQSLWMTVRTRYGIGQSISVDGGNTWSMGTPSGIEGPNSRFFIRRLQSSRLLLVNHTVSTDRSRLAATLSEDDGRTWQGCLMLDERAGVSYPDGVQDERGNILVVYDRGRYEQKEILMCRFTEEDIRAGMPVSKESRMKMIVNKI